MTCEYVKCNGYHIVFTPHFLARQNERKGIDIFNGMDFDHLFHAAEETQCYALPVAGSLYLYLRKQYNRRRQRWELELISLTPDQFLQTNNTKFAIPFPTTDSSSDEDEDEN